MLFKWVGYLQFHYNFFQTMSYQLSCKNVLCSIFEGIHFGSFYFSSLLSSVFPFFFLGSSVKLSSNEMNIK